MVETGSTHNLKRRSKKSKIKDVGNIELVKNIVDANPEKSVRQVKRETGLLHGTVFRILKKELEYRVETALCA